MSAAEGFGGRPLGEEASAFSSGQLELEAGEDEAEPHRVSTIVHQAMPAASTSGESSRTADHGHGQARTAHSSTIVHEAPHFNTGSDGALPRDPRVERQRREFREEADHSDGGHDKAESQDDSDSTEARSKPLEWGDDRSGAAGAEKASHSDADDGASHHSASSSSPSSTSHSDGAADNEACRDARIGDDCYDNVTWAKTRGIWAHPEWYPGLHHSSSRDDFQRHLFQTSSPGFCKKPCPGSISELREQQKHGQEEDAAWDRACYFDFNGGAATKCFCQLAGNRGCQGEPCVCPQGCTGVTWDHSKSVTFRNKAKAYGCDEPTALLTIPKSYFSQIHFLKTWCPTGMKALIEEMLREGFNSYTEFVGPAPVQQCIHAATSVSTAWLHLHTFCGAGHVDGMPTVSAVAWCSAMTSPDEAADLADEAISWASGLYGPLAEGQPSNCAAMGCGSYGPAHRCSCNGKCVQYGDCCPDYQEQCAAR